MGIFALVHKALFYVLKWSIEERMRIMFCSKCGHEIKNGSKFCGNCGAEIKNSDTELLNQSDTEKIHMDTESDINQEVYKTSETTSGEGKKLINKSIIGIILSVVVLATIGYFVYKGEKKFLFNHQNSSALQNNNAKQAKINITQVNTDNFPRIKVYFSVLDENDNVISKLNSKYFKISEGLNSNSKTINQVMSEFKLPDEDESLNLNLVMDVSDSMQGLKIQQAKEAASNF